MPDAPGQFYTGLVADLYRPLRGGNPDPAMYEKFIRRHGEPALELGCGDGDPILALRQHGIDVDGVDISPDMLERARARADQLGVAVDLFAQSMETLDLPRRYRSIYLAGATFTLLRDDDAALRALTRMRAHLTPDGCALVPLFIPDSTPAEKFGQWKSDVDESGRTIRFAPIAERRDDTARTLTTALRYERLAGDGTTESLERDFVIHWYEQQQFRDLASEAGLTVVRRIPEHDATTAFAFWLRVRGS